VLGDDEGCEVNGKLKGKGRRGSSEFLGQHWALETVVTLSSRGEVLLQVSHNHGVCKYCGIPVALPRVGICLSRAERHDQRPRNPLLSLDDRCHLLLTTVFVTLSTTEKGITPKEHRRSLG